MNTTTANTNVMLIVPAMLKPTKNGIRPSRFANQMKKNTLNKNGVNFSALAEPIEGSAMSSRTNKISGSNKF